MMSRSLGLLVLIVLLAILEKGALTFAIVLPLALSLAGRVSEADFLTWSFVGGLMMDLVGLGRLGFMALSFSLFALGLLLIRKFLPGKNAVVLLAAVIVMLWIDGLIVGRGSNFWGLMASVGVYVLLMLIGRRFAESNLQGRPLILKDR